MTKLIKICTLLAILTVAGCSTEKCQEGVEGKKHFSKAVSKEKDPMSETPIADRVRIYKPDGSLQCNQGEAIPLPDMEKDLAGIQVFSRGRRNDGVMRIQLCGSPTGMCNVYEIPRKDLAAALKLNFKEWLGP